MTPSRSSRATDLASATALVSFVIELADAVVSETLAAESLVIDFATASQVPHAAEQQHQSSTSAVAVAVSSSAAGTAYNLWFTNQQSIGTRGGEDKGMRANLTC